MSDDRDLSIAARIQSTRRGAPRAAFPPFALPYAEEPPLSLVGTRSGVGRSG